MSRKNNKNVEESDISEESSDSSEEIINFEFDVCSILYVYPYS